MLRVRRLAFPFMSSHLLTSIMLLIIPSGLEDRFEVGILLCNYWLSNVGASAHRPSFLSLIYAQGLLCMDRVILMNMYDLGPDVRVSLSLFFDRNEGICLEVSYTPTNIHTHSNTGWFVNCLTSTQEVGNDLRNSIRVGSASSLLVRIRATFVADIC